jgi:hypothetical protein
MVETNWAHFEKKLSFGKTLDEAAAEMGLSPDIVRERYNDMRDATCVYTLEASGSRAIESALATLQEICAMAEDNESRVAAAGHLLKFGVAAMRAAQDKKRTRIEQKSTAGMVDLFDSVGDWVLKKPGV